jgi:hypothetical protein
MENYKLQATNPTQYDSPELDWRIDGNADSTSRFIGNVQKMFGLKFTNQMFISSLNCQILKRPSLKLETK